MIKAFSPPTFQDTEKTRKSEVLYKILLISGAIITLMEFINIILLTENLYRWIIIICIYDLVCLGLLIIVSKGYYHFASAVFISFCIILASTTSWTAGGISSNAFHAFYAIVLLSGLLLGWKECIITGIIIGLIGLGFVLANNYDILPVPVVIRFPLSIWITSISTIAFLSLLQYFSISGLDKALNKAYIEIASRKNLEQTLIKSEAYRQSIFESSRIPIIIMDAQTYKFIDFNQAAIKIYGFSAREEVLSKSPINVSPPEQYDGTRSEIKAKYYIDKALAEGSIVFEWKHQRPSGEFWDAEVHLMSFEADNHPLLQFTLLDITERKKTEKALRESEERFRLILETMPILLNAFDEKGHFIVWNKACEEVTGYSAEEMIENPSAMDLLYPDSKYRQEVWNTSQDTTNKNNTFDLVTKNGEIRTIEWFDTYHFLTIQGWASWGMGLDITERKLAENELVESEARFKTFSSFANEGLMIHKDGIILDVNQAFCNLFGIQHPSDLIGRNSFEVVRLTPESKEKIVEHIKRNSEETYDIDIFHSNGKIIPAETKGIEIIFKGEKARLVYMRDISERKLAEQKLIESEARYRFISENTADVIWTLSLDTGKYTFVSAAVEKQRGFTPEEVMNQTMADALTPESLQKVTLLMQQRIAKRIAGETGQYTAITEVDQVCKDGTIINTEASTRMIFNEQNKPVEIIGVSRDITERKHTEEKLKESEARYRFISENTADVIWTLDLVSGKFTYVSPAVERLRGYSAEEVMNQTMSDSLTAESALKADKLFQNAVSLRIPGDTSTFRTITQLDQPCKNGTVVPTEVASTVLFNEKGVPSQVIGVSRDITERKQAEEKLKESEAHYRYLFEQNPAPMLIYKLGSLNLLAVNESFLKHYGYTLSEALSLKLTDLYPEEEQIKISELTTKLKGLAYVGEWNHLKKDGTQINIEAHSHGLLFEGQESRIAVINDITQLKNIENALIRNEDRLQKLLRSVTDYIYTVKIENGTATETIHGDGCIAVTGYSAEEFNTDKYLWYKIIFKDDKELVSKQIVNMLDNKELRSIEHRIIHKNKSVQWVRNTSVLRCDANGVLTGYDGLIVNITERKVAEEKLKESEKRYRNLFESANDSIFIMKEGKFIDCNLMAAHLFDYPKNELIKISPWNVSPLLQPDGRTSEEKAIEHITKVLNGNPQRFEWQHLRSDNTIIETEVSLNKIEIPDENLILAVVRDIRERKRFEKEVYISTFKGEENERARLAKDLHDGLGPLISACKIYHHNLNQLKFEQDELESYSRLGELLDESMFTIREISNNLSPHILRNFGLVDAIRNFADKLKTSLKIEIKSNCEAGKRYNEVVEATLYRVLIELLNNTLKYANAKNVKIVIEETETEFHTKYNDDGIGFNYMDDAKLTNGFGILNIHSRIKSIGGKINYKSKKNKGVDVDILINL